MKKRSDHNKPMTGGEAVLGEWLYLAPEGVDVIQIAKALDQKYDIELWEEAGVLEIIFGEKKSVDMEHVKIHPKDALTTEYVEKNGCKEVFLVTFDASEFTDVKPIMQQILTQCGGLFCGDTEDFEPVVREVV